MKALYLSYDGILEGLGQSQILPYLEGLSKHPVRFHLITFEKTNHNKAEVKGRCEESNIQWTSLSYTKKPPVLSTIFDLIRLRLAVKRILKEGDVDIVHCRSYLPMLIAMTFRKRFSYRVIFDMRGFWPEERVEGGIWNLKNPLFRWIYRFFKQKEKVFLSSADAVISLTHAGKASLIERFPSIQLEEKTSVIPCCVRLDLFDDRKEEDLQEKVLRHHLQLSNKTVFAYLGSIGTWYMLDEILRFFMVQWKKNPNAFLLFLTKDAPEPIYRNAATIGIPKECLLVVSVPHSQIAMYLKLVNYGLYFIRPTFSKTASSPIKQAEFMAMGIPIITNRGVGDSNRIIEASKAGVLIQDFTQESFESCVLPDRPNLKDIRNFVFEHFSLEKGVEKYREIYLDLCPKSLS